MQDLRHPRMIGDVSQILPIGVHHVDVRIQILRPIRHKSNALAVRGP